MKRLMLTLVCGAIAVGVVADPDAKPYDGGDWAKDRLNRGLVPNPTGKDFARAKAEWRSYAKTRADWGPSPQIGEANEKARVSEKKVYVSPSGDDANDGSAARPLRTLLAARNAVRRLLKSGASAEGVTVVLYGGTYPMTEPLCLDAADSGRPGRPVLWMSAEGETAVLDGGCRLTDWRKVSDPALLARLRPAARRHVRVADVKAAGAANFVSPGPRGFEVDREGTASPVSDFYIDGVRQDLAIWPKTGWHRLSEGSATNNVVGVAFDDWSRWLGERALYARMYPACYWADLTTPVLELDPQAGTMTTFGRRGRTQLTRKGFPFKFLNALSALERPGECVCDWERGLVYAWMPKGEPGDHDFVVSDFSRTFVAMRQVENVEFRGLAFRYGRANALELSDSRRITLSSCSFVGFGQRGVSGRGVAQVTVDRCAFRDFGYIALFLSGGDRKTLASSGVVVQNCDFSRSGNWMRDFAQSVCFTGCGAHIRWNRFHDVPGAAVRLNGNDVLFASNVVERCDYECGDNGALDIYANPTYAVRIVHNLWRDIGSGEKGFAEAGQAAIRFDDAVSNQIVYGNRFENCSPATNVVWGFGCVQVNGGRNNTIENNLFCGWRAISYNAWPMRNWTRYMGNAHVTNAWAEVMGPGSPYPARYPGIDGLREMEMVNRVLRNVQVGTGRFVPLRDGLTVTKCNFAYRETPTRKTLNANPVWDPLPPLAALGPRP